MFSEKHTHGPLTLCFHGNNSILACILPLASLRYSPCCQCFSSGKLERLQFIACNQDNLRARIVALRRYYRCRRLCILGFDLGTELRASFTLVFFMTLIMILCIFEFNVANLGNEEKSDRSIEENYDIRHFQ